MRYTLEHQLFLYHSYVEKKSYKSRKRRFCHKYSGIRVEVSSTVLKSLKKVHSTESFLDKKCSKHNAMAV
jgi:hypothetical protein